MATQDLDNIIYANLCQKAAGPILTWAFWSMFHVVSSAKACPKKEAWVKEKLEVQLTLHFVLSRQTSCLFCTMLLHLGTGLLM